MMTDSSAAVDGLARARFGDERAVRREMDCYYVLYVHEEKKGKGWALMIQPNVERL